MARQRPLKLFPSPRGGASALAARGHFSPLAARGGRRRLCPRRAGALLPPRCAGRCGRARVARPARAAERLLLPSPRGVASPLIIPLAERVRIAARGRFFPCHTPSPESTRNAGGASSLAARPGVASPLIIPLAERVRISPRRAGGASSLAARGSFSCISSSLLEGDTHVLICVFATAGLGHGACGAAAPPTPGPAFRVWPGPGGPGR